MFDESFVSGFLEETNEILEKLEADLLSLEMDPTDMDIISSVFRSFHTIKGSGAMFGFSAISKFTHYVEDLLDRARAGTLIINKEMISLILVSKDHIQELLENEDRENLNDTSKEIIARVKVFLDANERESGEDLAPSTNENTSETIAVDDHVETNGNKWFYIKFEPSEDFFFFGSKPYMVISELSEDSNQIFLKVNTDKIPPLGELNPENMYLYWDIFVEKQIKKKQK